MTIPPPPRLCRPSRWWCRPRAAGRPRPSGPGCPGRPAATAGSRLGGADPDQLVGAGGQGGQGGLGDQPPGGDDHHLVDGLGDLGQDMAGDQHGAALVGQLAQEPAQPVDAFGVQAVGRLVQDQHLGVAEQGGGQAQALAHAQREATDPPAGRLGRPTWARTSSARAGAGRRRWRPAGGCGRCGRDGSWRPPAPRRRGGWDRPAPGTACRRSWPLPAVGVTRPSRVRRVVVLPAPLGPRKPTTVPWSTSKLRSSTATTSPKRLVSPSMVMTAMASSSAPAGLLVEADHVEGAGHLDGTKRGRRRRRPLS